MSNRHCFFYTVWSIFKSSKHSVSNLGSIGFSSLQETISFQFTVFHHRVNVYKKGLLTISPISANIFSTWILLLTRFDLTLVRKDLRAKRSRSISLNFLALLLPNIYFLNTCICRLPPVPDDPAYADHFLERYNKELAVLLEKNKEQHRIEQEKLLQEAAKRQAEADAEQQWNDDFSDLTLFVLFGEILIFMISAYRRSSGW